MDYDFLEVLSQFGCSVERYIYLTEMYYLFISGIYNKPLFSFK